MIFVLFILSSCPPPLMGLGWQAGTQNLPLPNRLRAGRRTNPEGPKVLRTPSETPMEDPFGKSQERPKVFRITSVVLLKDWGTKDLREVFTFDLLVAHRGAFSYCLAAVLGFFSTISKSHGRSFDEGQACFLKYPRRG